MCNSPEVKTSYRVRLSEKSASITRHGKFVIFKCKDEVDAAKWASEGLTAKELFEANEGGIAFTEVPAELPREAVQMV